MELRQLQYFVAVAEELHFGRAAERLHMAQSTVSQQIQRLERELKLHLFERTSRTVTLSSAGHRMLARARAVLEAAEAMTADARGIAGARGEGLLRLGTGSSLGNRLDLFLDALMDHDPELRVQFRNLAAPERLEQIRNGELDAAVVRGVTAVPGLRLLPLWDDRLVAVLSATHPLARQPAVTLDGLRDLPLRIVPREVNSTLYDLVYSACAAAGFRPVIGRPFTTRHDTLAEIAMGCESWTVLYASNAEADVPRRLVRREFADARLAVPVGLVVRAGLPSERLERLAAVCAEVHQQLVE